MLNSVDFSGKPFHFIGIGGIGMSALAWILAKRNLPVSGSDLKLSHITQRLQAQGDHIFWEQTAANLDFFAQRHCSETGVSSSSPVLPQVICSTAINPSNSEYLAAKALGCPIFHRSDVLAALIREHQGIAVAGTHGKTTTSSLVGYLLLQANLDPTIIIGGEVAAWGGNARVGQGPHLVAEADESDGSLAKLSARFGIITNIELDHPDHYSSLEQVVDIFKTFQQQCHTTIGCIDCPTVRTTIQPDISYSLEPTSGADYIATDLRSVDGGTVATIWEAQTRLGDLYLPLLGQHNVSNALAAIALGRQLELPFAQIAESLKSFHGPRRRFEQRGEFQGTLFIDDYGHHPSEIEVTLAAAQLKRQQRAVDFPEGRVIAIFQPHRYSRSATFISEFARAFGHADQVIVTDIYSAGEQNTHQISGETVAAAIAANHPKVNYCPTLDDVQQTLKSMLRSGDIALFFCAGNLNQIIPAVMERYQPVDVDHLQTVSSCG